MTGLLVWTTMLLAGWSLHIRSRNRLLDRCEYHRQQLQANLVALEARCREQQRAIDEFQAWLAGPDMQIIAGLWRGRLDPSVEYKISVEVLRK